MKLQDLLKNKNDNIAEITYNVLWGNYLINWRKEHDAKRGLKTDFHASSLIDKNFCFVRATIDEIIEKANESFSTDTLALFINGIDVHKKHQKFFIDTGLAYHTPETTFYSEFLDMFATPDGIIKFIGNKTIAEIKSMRSTKFNHLEEVPYEAYCQSQIYMYMTAIPQAIVIIENKDDQKIKVFPIKFNLKDAYNLIKRRRTVMKYLHKKFIPIDKRICNPKKSNKKCKYNQQCFNINEIKDLEKMIP